MSFICSVVLSILVSGTWSLEHEAFPPWFMFGASTAAYQVKGAWNTSDKGEGGWYRLLHTRPGLVADHSNGDVACDSYHFWRRDIEMAVELGLDMYRFSISWPRLLPNGFANYISEDGKNYYNSLIDGLLERGIEPIVTIYHFDLPQIMQDLGGWANPLISDWFSDYARVAYSLYADRVKYWLTLNEPLGICDGGYTKGAMPYLEERQFGMYICNKNVLLSHAKAWRIYDEEFRHKYHGKVSLSTLFFWFMPTAPEDEELTELTLEYWVPMTSTASTTTRRALSARLRRLKEFYGSTELNMVMFNDPSWPSAGPEWFPITSTYGVKEVMITENGDPSVDPGLADTQRLEYIRDNLEQIQLAITDGLNVTGYTVWALMDNFEWLAGYSARFGLYAVDFTDPNRTRTPRQSAQFYARVTRSRSLQPTPRLCYE